MRASRTANAKRNLESGILNKIVLLLIPFLTRTVLIRVLGAEYLGLSSLFTSILQVLNMAELGFSTAITYCLYKPLADEDTNAVCAYLTFFRRVYKLIGLIVIGVAGILMPFLPRLINGSYPADINIYLLYIIYVLNTAVSYLFWGYKTILLSAVQKRNIISNVDTILGIVQNIVQLLILIVLQNYYFYVACLLVSTLLNNVIVGRTTDKLYPQYKSVCKLGNTQKKEVMRQVGGIAIGKLSNTARNSFDSILLSYFCGLVATAVYSNYYYVINAVVGFVMVLTEALAAGVGDSVASESAEKNYKDFKMLYFFFCWIGTWCTICMLCLYQPFMKIWVGENLMVDNSTMILFVIYFYILAIGQLRSIYSRAAGIWWRQRYLAIGEAVSNLILNFVLGALFGMAGILWATITTVTLFSIIGIGKMTINECFHRSSREFFLITGLYSIWSFAEAVIIYFLCSRVSIDGIGGLVIKGIICLIIPNLIMLGVSQMNHTSREYMKDIICRLQK